MKPQAKSLPSARALRRAGVLAAAVLALAPAAAHASWNLAVSMTAAPGSGLPGVPVRVTASVTNIGDAAAPPLAVLKVEPFGYVVAGSGFCSDGGMWTGSGCTFLPSIGPGQTRTAAVTATPFYAGKVLLTGRAFLAGPDKDSQPADDEASASYRLALPDSDLAVQAPAPGPVAPGQEFTLPITAVNRGPDTPSPVSLAVTLPADFTYLSSSGASGGCSAAVKYEILTGECRLDLPAGSSRTVGLRLRAPARPGSYLINEGEDRTRYRGLVVTLSGGTQAAPAVDPTPDDSFVVLEQPIVVAVPAAPAAAGSAALRADRRVALAVSCPRSAAAGCKAVRLAGVLRVKAASGRMRTVRFVLAAPRLAAGQRRVVRSSPLPAGAAGDLRRAGGAWAALTGGVRAARVRVRA